MGLFRKSTESLHKLKSAVRVKHSLIYKFIFLFLIILFMDCGVSINNYYHNRFAEYEEKIVKLEFAVKEYQLQEQEYQDSLKRIVSNLYEEELFVEAGGSGIDIDTYSIDLIYEAIMNASMSFRELLTNVENYFNERKEYLDDIPSIWPIEYSPIARITDNFGVRIYPFTGTLHFHRGIDIAATSTTKIVATADGRVVNHYLPPDGKKYKGDRILGGMIEIDHGNGFSTVYGHLSKTYVSEIIGAKNNIVERGQVIGIVGNTGKSMGIHLHYEVRKNGIPVNPIEYLSSNRTVFMNERVDLK